MDGEGETRENIVWIETSTFSGDIELFDCIICKPIFLSQCLYTYAST